MSNNFVRCDDEFEVVEQDLDMSSFRQNHFNASRPFTLPDISREMKLFDTKCKEHEGLLIGDMLANTLLRWYDEGGPK